jgi:hypothetical protein
MPGPADDSLKHLTELSAPDWVVRGGWPPALAHVIDADIATISGAADKVIRVNGTPEWMLAVDFHAGHDVLAKLPELLLYNTALFRRHRLPVRSLLVLLHRGADSPQLTGVYERGFPGEPADVMLRYRTVRVWQVPAPQWLSGGLGLLPLAPLGDVRADELPAILSQVKQRLEREAAPREAADLWSATFILMGLRYERALIQQLVQGVRGMKESVTYQAILEEGEAKGLLKGKAEGKAEEARRMLVLFGQNPLGEPSAEVKAALEAIADVNRLEELAVRVNSVASWQELLGLPAPRRRSPRRKARNGKQEGR